MTINPVYVRCGQSARDDINDVIHTQLLYIIDRSVIIVIIIIIGASLSEPHTYVKYATAVCMCIYIYIYIIYIYIYVPYVMPYSSIYSFTMAAASEPL